MRTARPVVRRAADVGGLAGVLEAVADDAHQPDAERHRRVPSLVDDPVEVGDRREVRRRPLLHGAVVGGERVEVGEPDLRHVVGVVSVAGVTDGQVETEPLVVPLGGEDLLVPRQARKMVVHDPG